MIIRELITKFGFVVDEKNLNLLDGRIASMKTAFQHLQTTATVALSFLGIKKFIGSTLEAADGIAKLSKKTGIGVSSLQALDYVAKISGTDVSTLTTAFRRLSMNILEAREGSKDSIRKFQALGITTRELADRNLNLEEIFLRIGDRISKLSSNTERVAYANELFGRSGTELLPFFAEGRKGIDDLIARYRSFGIEMTPDVISKSEELKDKLDDIRLISVGLKNALVSALIPSLLKLVNRLIPVVIASKNLLATSLTPFLRILGKTIYISAKSFFVFGKAIDNILSPLGGLTSISKVLIPILATMVTAAIIGKFIAMGKIIFSLVGVATSLSKQLFLVGAAIRLINLNALLWIALFSSLFLLIDDIVAAFRGAKSLFSDSKWIDALASKLAPVAEFFMPKRGAIVTQPYKKEAGTSVSITSNPVINVNGARDAKVVADEVLMKIQEQNERDRRQAVSNIRSKIIE